ncbi:hypothetical protein ACQP2P_39650 [Dactylosporangium sp. CA-139114]|uniref:hypothetical protein n=1 Tax=Dactylosporangium sp. CA-139114 TaxID=3239931 RepID=UPI003D97FFBF
MKGGDLLAASKDGRQIAYDLAKGSARGVSGDDRYVTVGWLGTDPSRAWDTFATVDTTTGKAVTLQASGTSSSPRAGRRSCPVTGGSWCSTRSRTRWRRSPRAAL